MSKGNIIKAWKNRKFRQSLSEAELAALPAHPAGATILADNQLDGVAGGLPPSTARCTLGNCTIVCTVQDWCSTKVC